MNLDDELESLPLSFLLFTCRCTLPTYAMYMLYMHGHTHTHIDVHIICR